MNDLQPKLQAAFPGLLFESEVSLAPFTAINIGGPAEVLASITATSDLEAVISFCHQRHITFTMLGWGANTLIADRGIRGLVIRNRTNELEILEGGVGQDQLQVALQPRHQALTLAQEFSTLDYQEAENTPRVRVSVASGWPFPSLIAKLLSQGVTGLQWYSRIPATVGGAVVNNIHGGTHFISEIIDSVTVLNSHNQVVKLSRDECQFEYDYSRFHHSNEVILSVQFLLWRGDAKRAQAALGEWAKRKQMQPQRSLGCVFQNISSEDQERLHLPTPGVGYIIDQVLNLKGKRIGGAQISLQHAAFIENVGEATAEDYLMLVLEIRQAAADQLGIRLMPEIFFKGFSDTELSELQTDNSL